MQALCALLQLELDTHRWLDERTWLAMRCSCRALYSASEHPLFPKLMPHQRLHFTRLRRALLKHGAALDGTRMGGGKSYTASALSKSLRRRMVVFGPASAELNWRAAFAHFDLVAEFYPYSRVQAAQPPYLRKQKQKNGTVEFSALPEWQLIQFLVLDEMHHLNNKSQRFEAMLTLVHSMHNGLVLGQSGTPLDRYDQEPQLAKLLGIVQREPLAQMNLQTGKLQLIGLRDAFDYCERLEPSFVLPSTRRSLDDEQSSLYALHQCIIGPIKRNLFFSMPNVPRQHPRLAQLLVCDLPLDDEHSHLLVQGLRTMQTALGLLASRHHVDDAMGLLMKGLQRIELAKVPHFIEFAKRQLHEPNTKVLLMVNFTETLHQLRDALLDWRPLVFKGTTTAKARNRMRTEFQAASLDKRLLISNLGLLSEGCDLDDQHGKRPRRMGISPSYRSSTQLQIAGRVDRPLTQSQAKVYYLISGDNEAGVVAALSRKAQLTSSLLRSNLPDPSEFSRALLSEL